MKNAKALSSFRSGPIPLTQDEFVWIKNHLYRQAGIVLGDGKQALVVGRLDKRLRYYGFNSYRDYFRSLGQPGFEQETVLAIDLLTTNETYFFREPKHFEFLKEHFFPNHNRNRRLRVWSAASSSGEEAYTIAMLLSEHCSLAQWEILGTDISTRILDKARRGLYPMVAAEKVPLELLRKYCLKGADEYEGFFLINESLRKRTTFKHANLVEQLPDFGLFDLIFLRNVMIYFDLPTKQKLIERIQNKLNPGGYLIISHSESLNGMASDLRMVVPSVYLKPVHE